MMWLVLLGEEVGELLSSRLDIEGLLPPPAPVGEEEHKLSVEPDELL